MRHREAPLLVDVVIKQHATQQSGGVAWGQGGRRQSGRHGGRRSAAPGASRLLLLKQILSQDSHQVFIQTHMVSVMQLFGGNRQRVLAAPRLSHSRKTKVAPSRCLQVPVKATGNATRWEDASASKSFQNKKTGPAQRGVAPLVIQAALQRCHRDWRVWVSV